MSQPSGFSAIAAFDLAKATFPNPKRIVLAGSSAGGFGTIIGTELMRLEYPNTPLIEFNDAGVGLAPSEPAYTTIKNEWKFDQFIPASCTECQGGQQTPVIAWGLRNDPSLRVAAFSSYGDAIEGGTFLGLAPADFKTLLMSQTDPVHAEFPTRFERLDGKAREPVTSAAFRSPALLRLLRIDDSIAREEITRTVG